MKTNENEIGHLLEGWRYVEKDNVKYLRRRGTKTSILIELPNFAYVSEIDDIIRVKMISYDGVMKFYCDVCYLRHDEFYEYLFFTGDKL